MYSYFCRASNSQIRSCPATQVPQPSCLFIRWFKRVLLYYTVIPPLSWVIFYDFLKKSFNFKTGICFFEEKCPLWICCGYVPFHNDSLWFILVGSCTGFGFLLSWVWVFNLVQLCCNCSIVSNCWFLKFISWDIRQYF